MCDDIKLQTLENLLKTAGADYSIFKDDQSFGTAAEGAKQYDISLNETAPTFILKSKDKYYSVIVCGNRRISFKKLKQVLAVKDISMAEAETVLNLTGAKVGEVGLINQQLQTIIDRTVLDNDYCYGGTGVTQATLRINTQDLMNITHAQILDFTEAR